MQWERHVEKKKTTSTRSMIQLNMVRTRCSAVLSAAVKPISMSLLTYPLSS